MSRNLNTLLHMKITGAHFIEGGGLHPSPLGCKRDLFMGCSLEGRDVCVSVAEGEGWEWDDNDGG